MTDTRQLTTTPMPALAPNRLPVMLALLAVYAIWGSTYLAVRIAVETFPPFMMSGIRFLIAGSILFMIARSQGLPVPTRTQWRNAALIGALMMGGGMGLVAFAEKTVASGLTALLVSAMPLWLALFDGVFGRWCSRQEWVGLIVGFSGVVLLNLEGDLRGNPVGAFALLCAAAFWAFGSVLSRRLNLPSGTMLTGAELLTGGVVLLGMSVVAGEQLTTLPSVPSLLAFAYLIVFGSIIAFSAYNYLLGNVRASLATSYAYVNPVVALLLGMALVGETISPLGVVAIPLILSGVAILTLLRSQRMG